jgi:hypothetical protein
MYFMCLYSYYFLLLDLRIIVNFSSLYMSCWSLWGSRAAVLNHIYLEVYVAYMLYMLAVGQKGLKFMFTAATST